MPGTRNRLGIEQRRKNGCARAEQSGRGEPAQQHHGLGALGSGEAGSKNRDPLGREQRGGETGAGAYPRIDARRPREQGDPVAGLPEQQHGHKREQHGVHDDDIQRVERAHRHRQGVGPGVRAQQVSGYGNAEKSADVAEQNARPYHQTTLHQPAPAKIGDDFVQGRRRQVTSLI